MPCYRVRVGDSVSLIRTSRRLTQCRCGRLAERECDWKIAPGATCDAPICSVCTVSPSPGKDLCPAHAIAWAKHRSNPLRLEGENNV
jgi:hypothetical protein